MYCHCQDSVCHLSVVSDSGEAAEGESCPRVRLRARVAGPHTGALPAPRCRARAAAALPALLARASIFTGCCVVRVLPKECFGFKKGFQGEKTKGHSRAGKESSSRRCCWLLSGLLRNCSAACTPRGPHVLRDQNEQQPLPAPRSGRILASLLVPVGTAGARHGCPCGLAASREGWGCTLVPQLCTLMAETPHPLEEGDRV